MLVFCRSVGWNLRLIMPILPAGFCGQRFFLATPSKGRAIQSEVVLVGRVVPAAAGCHWDADLVTRCQSRLNPPAWQTSRCHAEPPSGSLTREGLRNGRAREVVRPGSA